MIVRCPPRKAVRRLRFEPLELRRLLAFTVSPTEFEQEMLELINRMRADPQAELGRLINLPATNPATSSDPNIDFALRANRVDGRELQRQFSSLVPAPPLAWADALYKVAGAYAQRMIAAQQQRHDLPVGSNRNIAQEVFAAARDNFREWTNFSVSENLLGSGESVLYAHAALAIDWAKVGIQNPPGHRNQIMQADRREAGIAVVRQRVNDTVGELDVTGPFIVVQEFAARNPPEGIENPYLLGVAHVDSNNDGRYNAGEALRDVTVTVTGLGDTPTPDVNTTTTSYPSGAYQLRVPPGKYSVLFSGGELEKAKVVKNIEVLPETNRKVDLIEGVEIVVPTVRFNPIEQSTTEDELTVTVWPTLSALTNVDVHVPFAVSGTATGGADADYTVSPSPVVIPAGEWFAPITIRVHSDTISDPGETIILVMGEPTNATLSFETVHTTTIIDDDSLPTVEFTETANRVSEDVGELIITARLSTVSGRSISVPFSVTGTASGGGADYAISDSPLMIPAGSLSASMSLFITDEALDEMEETVIVSIDEPTFATRGAATTYTATVVDNDESGEWTNPVNRFDVTGDGLVASRDVLVSINELNARRFVDSLGQLPDRSRHPAAFYYDTTGDGILSPGDILTIINALNQDASGEATPQPSDRPLRPARTGGEWPKYDTTHSTVDSVFSCVPDLFDLLTDEGVHFQRYHESLASMRPNRAARSSREA